MENAKIVQSIQDHRQIKNHVELISASRIKNYYKLVFVLIVHCIKVLIIMEKDALQEIVTKIKFYW